MVVPDGTLFATGVGERIKSALLKEFNLHTIVRMPKGVFAPYTDIQTNLLFFERDGPTEEIWYYEHPLPSERQRLKNPCYSKTKPLRFEEFKPLLEWWNNRVENEHAWKVSAREVMANNCNLDIKNPNTRKIKDHKSPDEIVSSIIKKEKRIFGLMKEIRIHITKGWKDAN